MKSPRWWVVAGAIVLAWIGPCVAQCQWRPTSIGLGVTSSMLIVADWLTTADGVHRGYGESNLILGARPSLGRLNTYEVAALAGNLLIANALPEHARTVWLALVTGLQIGMVWHSTRIGLRLNWDL